MPKPEPQKIIPVTPQPQKTEAPPKAKKPKFISYVMYILIIGAGIALAKFGFDFLNQKFKAPLKDAKTQSAPQLIKIVPHQAPASAAAPAPAKSEEPLIAIKKKIQQTVTPYVLNGVYFARGKGYALINNQVLEEGNVIDEATVTKISIDGVELKVKDKILRLTIRGGK